MAPAVASFVCAENGGLPGGWLLHPMRLASGIGDEARRMPSAAFFHIPAGLEKTLPNF
jgi:hypothetical protein